MRKLLIDFQFLNSLLTIDYINIRVQVVNLEFDLNRSAHVLLLLRKRTVTGIVKQRKKINTRKVRKQQKKRERSKKKIQEKQFTKAWKSHFFANLRSHTPSTTQFLFISVLGERKKTFDPFTSPGLLKAFVPTKPKSKVEESPESV